MVYYDKTTSEIFKKFKTNKEGLSTKEVTKRQKRYGLNIIHINSDPLWKKLVEPFSNVFMLILFMAAVLSLVLNKPIDAVIVVTIMAISAIIFYAQRFSTDRALKGLSKHDAQNVDVMRNDETIAIDSTQLVPGDIITLSEGDKISADIRLIKSAELRVNESQLTGEALPVSKNPTILKGKRELYEQTNTLFQGSFIVSGVATGVVTATGNNTELGDLAVLSKREDLQSPIQQKIDKLITQIISCILAISVVAFGLSILRGMDVLSSLRFVMALAVSAVPESLPIAISVVLVLGMRRMAAKKALVHQMRAIETIGAINVIATDKTGTLTKNKLTVQEIWTLHSDKKRLNQIIAHSVNKGQGQMHDPVDIAMEDYSKKMDVATHGLPKNELPFAQNSAMSGAVWHYGNAYRVYIKGAPEHILSNCKLDEPDLQKAKTTLQEFTSKGYRVIGLASCDSPKSISSIDALPKKELDFEGFVAIADVLRPEVNKSIKAALAAGVSVRMITGDHAETAYQIAKQIDMVKTRDEVFDCHYMEEKTDEQLEEIVARTKVFSRVVPKQKYRLLTILKKNNITAMTGDGVNDVPALSNAHVGIAMGSGSPIAKDAGAIILLDNNFKTIIDAMHEGRIIISNIKRMLLYLLSTNAGEILTMLGALLVGIKTPLEPVQILWVNLVTDTTMVIPLGLEPGDKNIMKRKPQKPDTPILNLTMVSRMAIMALTMSALALGVYIYFEQRFGHSYAQTLTFASLIVSQWANALNARSDYESVFSRLRVMNGSFYAALLVSIILQIFVFFGPLGEILHITQVADAHLAIVALFAIIAPITTCELHKRYCRNQKKS